MTACLPSLSAPPVCVLSGLADWQFVAGYDAPPVGETDFGFSPYRRELWQSASSGHVVNAHGMDLSALYQGDYWNRTYPNGPEPIFRKIMALPPDRSDNRRRVARIEAYWRERAPDAPRTLLDIGAGLAVFPAAMREAGWTASALDPDPRAADHARDVAGVQGLVCDFLRDRAPGRYGLVSLNKVLEHLPPEPMIAMLARTRDALLPGGLVYVELPDGEGALADAGPDREEFFIEHYCAFSMTSFALLARRAGLRLDLLERVREPSGKYTLRGFLASPTTS